MDKPSNECRAGSPKPAAKRDKVVCILVQTYCPNAPGHLLRGDKTSQFYHRYVQKWPDLQKEVNDAVARASSSTVLFSIMLQRLPLLLSNGRKGEKILAK